MNSKKGPEITIDAFDPRKVADENHVLTQKINDYENQLMDYSRQLQSVHEALEDAERLNSRFRDILQANGINYDETTALATSMNMKQSLLHLTEENEKLKQLLQIEGIEYDEVNYTYQANKTRTMLQRAVKEVTRLRKLSKLPVLDIWDAVERGSIQYVKYFIQEDPTIVFALKNGTSPLHRAIELGDLQMINFLINHGGNVTAQTGNGTTTIMLAARSGNLDVFNFVHDKVPPEDLTKKRQDGLTLLHCAVSGGNIYIVKYIVNKGTEVNATTTAGVTPLMCIEEYNPQLFDFLIESGCNVLAHSLTNRTMIHVACRTGSYEFIQKVVSLGVPLDSVTIDGCNALHMAIVGGNQLVIQTLLNDFPIDCKTKLGYTPFLISIQAEDLELAKFLISCGSDISAVLEDGKTALHIAAYTGNIEICKYLLDNGVPIDCIDSENNTPIMIAAAQRSLLLVEFLQSRGGTLKEDFAEAVKKSPNGKAKILFDPMEELPRLRKENEELKKSQTEMKKIIDEYEADHPIIELAEEITQTDVSSIIHKRLINQIGIVTIAPDKDTTAKIKAFQDENRKLMTEISELSDIVSSHNALKVDLQNAEDQITKLHDEKLQSEKHLRSKKKKAEAEKQRLKNILNVFIGVCIFLLAALIYLIFDK